MGRSENRRRKIQVLQKTIHFGDYSKEFNTKLTDGQAEIHGCLFVFVNEKSFFIHLSIFICSFYLFFYVLPPFGFFPYTFPDLFSRYSTDVIFFVVLSSLHINTLRNKPYKF